MLPSEYPRTLRSVEGRARFALVALVAMSLAGSWCKFASATDYYWINSGVGDFSDSDNWTPPGGPGGSADTVNFNFDVQTHHDVNMHSGAASLHSKSLLVHNDSLNLNFENKDYELGSLGSLDPSLVVGAANGDVADLLVQGSPGSSLTTWSNTLIGRSGGSGHLTVNAKSLQWISHSGIYVGDTGIGLLEIAGDKGSVSSTTSVIGSGAGATGTARVTGSGIWNNTSLIVGLSGNGTLSTDGGTVSSSTGTIGSNVGSVGTANIGGTWNSSELFVGYSGTGTLNVDHGTVATTGSLYVGEAGPGTLNITNGDVTSGSGSGLTGAHIGHLAGSTGIAVVAGDKSTWTSGFLNVGSSGSGTLNISGGGEVSSIVGNVGANVGSIGTATITGPFSTWTNSGDLSIGNSGNGTLNIMAGGQVTKGSSLSSDAYIGRLAGSTGLVTVDGRYSTWTTSSLVIGDGGNGTLNISGEGNVNSSTGSIGSNVGSTGTVTVTGDDSTWTNSGGLNVGYSGSGTLNITARGRVTKGGDAYIGRVAGSTGAVNVSGTSSNWGGAGALFVGYGGTGTLTISDGGTVSSSYGFVGSQVGSNGNVTVEGNGSTWTVGGGLAISPVIQGSPNGGTGIVTVRSGGTINVSQTTTIGSAGTLRLEGGTYSTTAINFPQSGGQFQWISGTLHVDTYNGNLVNSGGKLAPGHSPGITTINGDYTQQADGVLEIEVGGTTLTPVTLHDQLVVNGTATLGGQLEVPIIAIPGQSYTPAPGQTITFLTATGGVIAGSQFDSVYFPNLPEGVAHKLHYNANNVQLEFVEPDVGGQIEFVATDQVAVWSNNSVLNPTWKKNGSPALPESQNNISIQNKTAVLPQNKLSQLVEVTTLYESVHELTVGDPSTEIAVRVNDKNLSVAVNTYIDANGVLELGRPSTTHKGQLTSQTTTIRGGGKLKGNGTIRGKLQIGTGGQTTAELHPGFSVGELNVEGDYEQMSDGLLYIDVEGDQNGDFDTVTVNGDAQLGGTLQIDVSQLNAIPSPGTMFPLVTASSITGDFDSVESTGSNDVFFRTQVIASGSSTIAYAVSVEPGDMNGDLTVNLTDVDLFVFALLNNSPTKWFEKCNLCILPEVEPEDGGDFDGSGRVDFGDITGFEGRLGQAGLSRAALMAAFDRYSNTVPEPHSTANLLLGIIMASAVHGRRQRQGLVLCERGDSIWRW